MNALTIFLGVTRDSVKGIRSMLWPKTLTVEEVKVEYDDVMSFAFSAKKPLQYRAGQYGVWFLNTWVWGTPVRLFTIAADDRHSLQITTHISKTDYKQKLSRLRPGDTVRLLGPIGQFTLPTSPEHVPLVFIAGGIGVTPMPAFVEQLAGHAQAEQATLLYSGRPGQYLYESLFTSVLGDRFIKTDRNHFEIELVSLIKKTDKAIYYVSGPPAFVESTNTLLKKEGITTIHLDGFLGY